VAEVAVVNTSSAILNIRLGDGSSETLLPGVETWIEQSAIFQWCVQNASFQDLVTWPGKLNFGVNPFDSISATATIVVS